MVPLACLDHLAGINNLKPFLLFNYFCCLSPKRSHRPVTIPPRNAGLRSHKNKPCHHLPGEGRMRHVTWACQTSTCHPLHISFLKYSQRQCHVGNVFFTVFRVTVSLSSNINSWDLVMSPAPVFWTTSVKFQSLTLCIFNHLFHWFFFFLCCQENYASPLWITTTSKHDLKSSSSKETYCSSSQMLGYEIRWYSRSLLLYESFHVMD